MASRLFALESAEVAEVDEEPGGGRTVWLVTADPGARACPVWRDGAEVARHGDSNCKITMRLTP